MQQPGPALQSSRALQLKNEVATAALGVALAGALLTLSAEVQMHGFTIGLMGDLGAGKTALVRALLRRAGVAGSVKSPTFALLEPYELSRLHFYHFDFYRFKNPDEFLERGFSEYFGPGAICLVEWPERASGYMPRVDLCLALLVEPPTEPLRDPAYPAGTQEPEPGRRATIVAHTPLGERCLQLMTDL